jgi:hypothetical protein
VLYHRVPRLFALLSLARGDGRYAKMMRQLGRVDLLILDDLGSEPLLPEQQRGLLEMVEDRYNVGSLVIASQLRVDWCELVEIPRSPTPSSIASSTTLIGSRSLIGQRLVETGSFAAAGRRQGRVTSAVSDTIANLETQLGIA